MTFFFAIAGLPGALGGTQPTPSLNLCNQSVGGRHVLDVVRQARLGVALRAHGHTHRPPSPGRQDAPGDGGGLPSGCAATAILVHADTPKDTEIDRLSARASGAITCEAAKIFRASILGSHLRRTRVLPIAVRRWQHNERHARMSAEKDEQNDGQQQSCSQRHRSSMLRVASLDIDMAS